MAGATIKKLTIERYRGIASLTWRPSPGLNLILGGGDVGKTTLLDAISLLFSPTNSTSVGETDFTNRDHEQGFSIEATIAAPPEAGLDHHSAFAWPWMWDGSDPVVPPDAETGDAANPTDQVYVVRVRASQDLELQWEVVQPAEETVANFSTTMRRGVGVIRLMGDDRNDRDLRLVYGSALDRLFDDSALRARIAQLVAEVDLNGALGEDGSSILSALGDRLKEAALPGDLSMGLTSSQGLSIGALIGLLASSGDTSLPLSCWGGRD